MNNYYVIVICLALVCSVCSGNENTFEYDPSVAGQLVPRRESSIVVKKEYLEIKFSKHDDAVGPSEFSGMPYPHFYRVHVRAVYYLYNPEDEARTLDLAFPILRTGLQEDIEKFRISYGTVDNRRLADSVRRGVRSEVKFNGKAIKHEYTSFESLFEKHREKWASGISKWLEQYPDLYNMLDDPEYKRKKDEQHYAFITNRMLEWERHGYYQIMRKYFPEIFQRDISSEGRERSTLLEMFADQARFHHRIQDWDLATLSHIYSMLYPEEPDPVGKFFDSWGAEDKSIMSASGKLASGNPWSYKAIHWDYASLNRRVNFLLYHPEIKAKKTAVVEVSYSHLVNGCIRWTSVENQNLFFQYILKSSGKWDKFGPIYIHVWVPRQHALSLPMNYLGEEEQGEHYSLTLEKGSQVDENLHIGLGGFDSRHLGEFYPAAIDSVAFYEKYLEDPEGPLADAYVACAADKMRAAMNAPDSNLAKTEIDCDQWLDLLNVKQKYTSHSYGVKVISKALDKKLSMMERDSVKTPMYKKPIRLYSIRGAFGVTGLIAFLFFIHIIRKFRNRTENREV